MDGACPCLYTTPCQPNCTCVHPYMSYGCRRCCQYGSLEQKKAKAKHLAALIDKPKLNEDKLVETYFIVRGSLVRTMTKSELEKALAENYWGSGKPRSLEALLEEPDTNYWGDDFLIIKGSVVVPKPVEVVTKFEV